MKTNTLPPIDIYDVLHEAEARGIELPPKVDDWWATETAINENPRCHECQSHNMLPKQILSCETCPELNKIIETLEKNEKEDEEN